MANTITNTITLNITDDDVSNRRGVKFGYNILKNNTIRSSVYDNDGFLQSFCPLSSESLNAFFTDDVLNENIRVEEFVEGTMINLYHDKDTWFVSTKNSVGGENNFYINGKQKQKSFKQMFYECCHEVNINVENLDKTYVYSFVMQHTDNRIINPVMKNSLYLISAYVKPYESNPTSIEMICDVKDLTHIMPLGSVCFPTQYDLTTRNDIIHRFAAPYTDYRIMGVNLFNRETGGRSKIRNPPYEELKKLRGNQAKIEYHYLTLRKEGRVDEFIDFFPEYTEDFNYYESKILNFTHTLYNNYVDCYMKHTMPLKQYDQKYKKHMYAIHDDYVKTKCKTDISAIDDYIYKIPEAILMSSINYEYRVEKE